MTKNRGGQSTRVTKAGPVVVRVPWTESPGSVGAGRGTGDGAAMEVGVAEGVTVGVAEGV